MRSIAACILIILGSSVASAQTRVPIVTGDDAARSFAYNGKPVHPLCVFFPFGSGRGEPIALAECTKLDVVPTLVDGWLGAESPGERNGGGASYRVLAKKADRYLVASSVSGGGTGQFSFLQWLRLSSTQIAISKAELGGDRCSGGLGPYEVREHDVRFAMNLTPRALALAAVPELKHEIEETLSERYLDCYAAAWYVYDFEREQYALASVELLSDYLPEPSPDTSTANSPPICMDEAIRQRIRTRRTTLSPSELGEFGRTFLACADAATRQR
jgi:hypothetical protein